jgi:hypothetical protein
MAIAAALVRATPALTGITSQTCLKLDAAQVAINMVNIYLHVEDRQVSDIERLSVRPVKWLRFVTFAICGVRGHLSATPNGPPVDYDSISLAGPIAEAYYYTPEGNIHRSHICRSSLISWFMPP